VHPRPGQFVFQERGLILEELVGLWVLVHVNVPVQVLIDQRVDDGGRHDAVLVLVTDLDDV
jgi:hypothetical protein